VLLKERLWVEVVCVLCASADKLELNTFITQQRIYLDQGILNYAIMLVHFQRILGWELVRDLVVRIL